MPFSLLTFISSTTSSKWYQAVQIQNQGCDHISNIDQIGMEMNQYTI